MERRYQCLAEDSREEGYLAGMQAQYHDESNKDLLRLLPAIQYLPFYSLHFALSSSTVCFMRTVLKSGSIDT